MLTIEDCLEHLDEINWTPVPYCGSVLEITSAWDRSFISDVAYHVREGKPISTAQGKLALKLIDRYKNHLEAKGLLKKDIQDLLEEPEYRQQPHISVSSPREVRYLGDSKIAFRCVFNRPVIDDIKTLKSNSYLQSSTNPKFDGEHKLWIVYVDHSNVQKTMDVIRRHNFNIDDEITEFFMEVINSKGQKSSATIEENKIIIQCRDDELFNSWINDLNRMGISDV